MASISRGRGWMQNDRTSLARPGRPLCPEDVNYTNLVNLINLVNDENLSEKVEEIIKFINDKVDKQNLNDVHEKLYKHALNNRGFGLKLLKVYNCPEFQSICDCEQRSLYRYFLRFFQNDYERRKDLREENVTQYHNAICLFSECLNSILSSRNSKFFQRLQLALLDYMEMLLETASAEDIKMFAEQMVVHGKTFHGSCKEKMDTLMIVARQILFKDNLSVTSRRILLYIIELENRDFNTLPNYVQKFYKAQLKNDFSQDENNVVIKSLTNLTIGDDNQK